MRIEIILLLGVISISPFAIWFTNIRDENSPRLPMGVAVGDKFVLNITQLEKNTPWPGWQYIGRVGTLLKYEVIKFNDATDDYKDEENYDGGIWEYTILEERIGKSWKDTRWEASDARSPDSILLNTDWKALEEHMRDRMFSSAGNYAFWDIIQFNISNDEDFIVEWHAREITTNYSSLSVYDKTTGLRKYWHHEFNYTNQNPYRFGYGKYTFELISYDKSFLSHLSISMNLLSVTFVIITINAYIHRKKNIQRGLKK